MSYTVVSRHGISIGQYVGPVQDAVSGDRRRVQVEVHGASALIDGHGAYVDLPLADALALLREAVEQLEELQEGRHD